MALIKRPRLRKTKKARRIWWEEDGEAGSESIFSEKAVGRSQFSRNFKELEFASESRQ